MDLQHDKNKRQVQLFQTLAKRQLDLVIAMECHLESLQMG
jgi:hypothetical protein